MAYTLVFATNNKHKIDEIAQIAGNQFRLLSLKEVDIHEEIEENADSLIGNAQIKARYVYEKTGLDCFADDTGLEVEALNGEPGVLSARYAGIAHDFKANTEKLLNQLSNINNRKACFRTVICLIVQSQEYYFEGKVDGKIIHSEKGIEGFGYDPIFMPDGYEITFAEMQSEEKNRISHRAKAFNAMTNWINNKPEIFNKNTQ